jgi:hypothetical protein
MDFKLLSEISQIETIAAGPGIHIRRALHKKYGSARWRKLKGIARIELPDGTTWLAEVHWYEAHGIGRKDLKLKDLLERLP